jgi:hypothetical protein
MRVRRSSLAPALLVSAAFHLAVATAPGWHLPQLPEAEALAATPLVAHLAAPAAEPSSAPTVSARVRPVAKPRSLKSLKPLKSFEPAQIAKPHVLALAAPVDDATTVETVPLPTEVEDAVGTESLAHPLHEQLLAEAQAEAIAPELDAAAVADTVVPRIELPRHGSIRFSVSRGERGLAVGRSTQRWQHDGQVYTLDTVTETTGLAAFFKQVHVVWKSRGAISVQGLQPTSFVVEKAGVRGDTADFDWATRRLKLSGGPQREVVLLAGAQDMLSMFYQLGFVWRAMRNRDESAGGRLPAVIELPVTSGRKQEVYRFAVIGRESVTLPGQGAQRALHLRAPAGEQIIDVWLGIELYGLPLKIRYTDGKGDKFEQNIEHIEFGD